MAEETGLTPAAEYLLPIADICRQLGEENPRIYLTGRGRQNGRIFI